jgi:hypothetical protein
VTFGKKNHEGIKMRLRFTRLIFNGFPGAKCGLNVMLYNLLAVHFISRRFSTDGSYGFLADKK